VDDFENYLTRYTDRDTDDEPDRDDCLNCGVCEWCIERSIAAAEEADKNTEEG